MRMIVKILPAAFFLFFLAFAGACGEKADISPPEWRVESDKWNAVLATPDLGIGERRFAFVLSSNEGVVRLPEIEVRSRFHPPGEPLGKLVEERDARFYPFPETARGLYSTKFNFDNAGQWSVEVLVPDFESGYDVATIFFEVREEPIAVDIDDMPPASLNPTLADVPDVSFLTTGSLYDEDLYRITIADALEAKIPFVVVFASPAFCTNAVCGPEVDVVSQLRSRYAAEMNFIHVDIYENPVGLQGDLSIAKRSRVADEWGLTSDEWTYVVGGEGRVVASFENFVSADELEEAILAVISRG